MKMQRRMTQKHNNAQAAMETENMFQKDNVHFWETILITCTIPHNVFSNLITKIGIQSSRILSLLTVDVLSLEERQQQKKAFSGWLFCMKFYQ